MMLSALPAKPSPRFPAQRVRPAPLSAETDHHDAPRAAIAPRRPRAIVRVAVQPATAARYYAATRDS
ncbi:hypothetical protein OG2516_06891 [Oceanicola granulosus HTCC2516]|uniref:Uncharacterized protein n=1 Tax=Oceanicola granulosus (strain ATCC BAA-861 / DSM 15982 / KCTC 12143 / HTCC2516) TaxID=314256 RepID=Q2CGE8_OCEGH|nr:hypothetical protein [Oceanicola granulosus]EAR51770.1 hypothetical protein OG2516_06891 [Oceanicola granulosus HTCC2516]